MARKTATSKKIPRKARRRNQQRRLPARRKSPHRESRQQLVCRRDRSGSGQRWTRRRRSVRGRCQRSRSPRPISTACARSIQDSTPSSSICRTMRLKAAKAAGQRAGAERGRAWRAARRPDHDQGERRLRGQAQSQRRACADERHRAIGLAGRAQSQEGRRDRARASTNTPEFSLRGFTDNPLHGLTLNPWDPEITCGGSSGGAGASVAAGIGTIAHGNDIGGSLRWPAHCNGIATIKPTQGRIPPTTQSATDRAPDARASDVGAGTTGTQRRAMSGLGSRS